MAAPPEAFADSDALIVGLWSDTGAMRQILRLGEAGVVRLVTAPRVLREVEDVVREAAPEALADVAVLLNRARVEVLEPASAAAVEALDSRLEFESDAEVLGCAIDHDLDWYLTYDWTDYLNNDELRRSVRPRIAPPGEFLADFTASLLPAG